MSPTSMAPGHLIPPPHQLMMLTMTMLVLQQVRDCNSAPEVPLRQFSVEQRLALQQVVRTMMGFGSESPSIGLRRHDLGHPSSGGHLVAPRYMHRLYEKYRVAAEAEGGGTEQRMADTVRNINSDLAIFNNGSLFVFNLTSLGAAETVLRAEIHIYKRRLKGPSNESCAAELPQSRSHPGFIVIKAYELGPRILRERASFRLPDAGHSGWNTFDVTSAIKACSSTLQRTGSSPHMLALSFSFADDNDDDGEDDLGRSRTRSRSSAGKLLLSKFVRKLSRPFLMVFSQENRNNSLDAQLDSLFRRGDERPADKGSGGGSEEDSWRWDYDNPFVLNGAGRSLARRKKRPVSAAAAPPSPGAWSSPSEVQEPRRQNLSDEIFVMESLSSGPDSPRNPSTTGRASKKYAVEEEDSIGSLARGRFYHAGFAPADLAGNVPAKNLRRWRRKRRAVDDNEIPQNVIFPDPEPAPSVYYNLPKTNPGILRGRSQTAGRKDPMSTRPPTSIEFGEEERVAAAEGSQRRRRKKGRVGVVGHGSQSAALLPRPHRGRGTGGRGVARRTDGSREVCGRRKLVVDFAEIGWREWIISPRSFEAHYCDGLCSYPMAPRLRPTNHATIQSIVKAIGLQAEVPSPCCVPASLSSVTLLYFDQNQNVVLKNYPDMTVRSCACR